jgi:Ser/Thr protein kinase RdoA (MazF antagonist)
VSRVVTLVVVDRCGEVLGALPPFTVASPWWPETAEVVDEVRAEHGIEVTVLRLLDAVPDPRSPWGMGGTVTYLAELGGRRERPSSLTVWLGVLEDHPLRASWARPGGPAADVKWATRTLAGLGRPVFGPAVQLKTWNLSSIWRMDTAAGQVWLKVVPPFCAHEGRILMALADGGRAGAGVAPVPGVLAADGARVLLADVPGEDQYQAPAAQLARMVDVLVTLQVDWADRSADLLDLGLPDWQPAPLVAKVATLVSRDGPALGYADERALGLLVATLDERLASLESCGLPTTLVHGDFHPGNLRADGNSLVLLDWGDSGVGHPLLDLPAFLDRVPAESVASVRRRWLAAWAEAVPGCDPERAAELIEPVAALRQAVIYRTFLDGIEPSERAYHAADVPAWLRRAAAMAHGV